MGRLEENPLRKLQERQAWGEHTQRIICMSEIWMSKALKMVSCDGHPVGLQLIEPTRTLAFMSFSVLFFLPLWFVIQISPTT